MARKRTRKPDKKKMAEQPHRCRFCGGQLPNTRLVLYSDKFDGYFCRISHFYALLLDNPNAGAAKALDELADPVKKMQELARIVIIAANEPDSTGLTGDAFGCAVELAGKILDMDRLL